MLGNALKRLLGLGTTTALEHTGYYNPQTSLNGVYNQPSDFNSIRRLLRY